MDKESIFGNIVPRHVLEQEEEQEEQISPADDFHRKHFHQARILLGISYIEYMNTPHDIIDYEMDLASKELAKMGKGDDSPKKDSMGPISHFHLVLMLSLSQLFGSEKDIADF